MLRRRKGESDSDYADRLKVYNESIYERERDRKRKNPNNSRNWYRSVDGVISVLYKTQRINSKRRGHPDPIYSVDDLKSHILGDEFMRLYQAWVASGYNRQLKPSCDRKDHTKPYTLDNIQLMTSHDNTVKAAAETKVSKGLAINQFDESGNLIGTFISRREAAAKTGVPATSISRCLDGQRKSANGYVFAYASPPRDFRSYKDELESLMMTSISTFGYYCHAIAIKSGFVIDNQSSGTPFPALPGFLPRMSERVMTVNAKRIATHYGLSSVRFHVRSIKTKLYFSDREAFINGIRALSVLDKALSEWITENPEVA